MESGLAGPVPLRQNNLTSFFLFSIYSQASVGPRSLLLLFTGVVGKDVYTRQCITGALLLGSSSRRMNEARSAM